MFCRFMYCNLKNYTISILWIFFMSACSASEDIKEIIPSVSIQDVEKIEGDDGTILINFSISLKEVYDKDIILSYTTDDGSAFQNLDYKKATGQLTIPAGTLEASIPIEIISDDIIEGSEVFHLVFNSDMELEMNKNSASILIINDDSKLPYDSEDYETPTSYQGWKLSWADEFDGPEINTDWWTHEIGKGDNGWGNNELEYYTDAPENSKIENGNLVIIARDDSWNGKKYTSARVITKDIKTFGYSRTDIRAKLPKGQGIWPALWMLGNNIDEKGWPACGEIDIMELIGNLPSTSHATVHFGSDFTNNYKYIGKSYKLSNEIFNDRFHVFSLVREFNQMWFYVDDILIFNFSSEDLQGQPNPFNEQFFFIFNVAIGGNWPGNPDETTIFPQQLLVDYIRVFEKE